MRFFVLLQTQEVFIEASVRAGKKKHKKQKKRKKHKNQKNQKKNKCKKEIIINVIDYVQLSP